MAAFFKALFFVVIAEMGDKTQLLAVALAAKYKIKEVFAGIFIATILNHGLAVAFGSFLSNLIPIVYVKIIAALSFIVFGLWTIRGDSIDDDIKKKKTSFGPIMTVMIAFFIAEFGDKTQLMTIAISAQYKQPLYILLGTTIGMMVADGIGILFGSFIAKHVPDIYIKWSAALVFLIFGIITLFESVPKYLLNIIYIIPFFIALGVCIYLVGLRKKPNQEAGSIKGKKVV